LQEVVADERSREDSTKTIEMPFDHDLSSAEIEEMVMGRQFAAATVIKKSEGAQEENALSAYAAASAASKDPAAYRG